MRQKKIIIGIIVFLFVGLALASSADAISFSRESFNNVGDSIGNWFKGGLFKWYSTDSSGDLRAEYETQRKIVDFLLFFIMFFSLALLGLKKVYTEGGNAVNALAFSIGALLALALVAFTKVTLGLLFPFAKNILFFIIVWVIYLVLSKIIGDDTTFKKLISLILAGVIAWFAFSFVSDGEGFNPFGMFDMATSTKDQSAKISELEAQLADDLSNDKVRAQLIRRYYMQGKHYVEEMLYRQAQDSFIQVIELDPNPDTNKYLDKAFDYLIEGIFNHMASNVLQIMEAKLYTGQFMVDEWKKSPTQNQGMRLQAIGLFNDVVTNGKILQEEIKNQIERYNRTLEIKRSITR